MLAKIRFSSLIFVAFLVSNVTSIQADEVVRFDAPATVECVDVTTAEFAELNPFEKLIRLDFYVAAEIDARQRQNIVELSFRVAGMTSRNGVVDFYPRNALETGIDGVIEVEKRNEKNSSIGLEAAISHESNLKAGGNANHGVKTAETQRFSQVPQHSPIVSSGFLNRGTGIFVKLFPSKLATLEGTHAISITFQVPADWRADLVMIDCQAKKKTDPFFVGESATSAAQTQFITPIYLAGDSVAKSLAQNYHRSETSFRSVAAKYNNRMSHRDFLERLKEIGTDYTRIDHKWIYRQLVSSGVEEPTLPRDQDSKGLMLALREFQTAKSEIRNLNR